jgi:glycerol-3-phosphate acyltransferase PlsY
MNEGRWILAVVLAWLLGSLPWGLWAGRVLKGIDERREGSGNLGATNVYRVLGPAPGIVVLLLDAAKGAAAVLAARALAGAGSADWAGLAALAASVLGHSFTPFAGFRGGKGVATAAGAWGVLAPWPLLLALGVWVVAFALTRIVSVGSLAAAAALPVAAGILRRGSASDPILWAAILTALLVFLRHRANLARLAGGREKALDLRGPREHAGKGGT